VLGAGVSGAHVVVEWEDHVFVGDLVANGHHGWLELGLTPDWHARLDEIARLGLHHVHPGRGASGGPELLDRQHEYLRTMTDIVTQAEPRLPIADGVIAGIDAQVRSRFPDLDHAVFLRVGLPAEYARVARGRAVTDRSTSNGSSARP